MAAVLTACSSAAARLTSSAPSARRIASQRVVQQRRAMSVQAAGEQAGQPATAVMAAVLRCYASPCQPAQF